VCADVYEREGRRVKAREREKENASVKQDEKNRARLNSGAREGGGGGSVCL